MLREKLRLMMLRDVTTFSTSSLVLSVPCLLLLPPSEKIRQSWISMDHTDFSNLQLSAPSLRFISSLISLSLFKYLFRIKCIYMYIYIYIEVGLLIVKILKRCLKSKSIFTFQSTRSLLLNNIHNSY